MMRNHRTLRRAPIIAHANWWRLHASDASNTWLMAGRHREHIMEHDVESIETIWVSANSPEIRTLRTPMSGGWLSQAKKRSVVRSGARPLSPGDYTARVFCPKGLALTAWGPQAPLSMK
jgi:hypothetical protein